MGPGDPLASVADIPELEFGAAVRMVSGPNGEILLALTEPDRILRIGPNGDRSWIFSGLRFSGGFALDAFGDLLVSGSEPGDTANHWADVSHRISNTRCDINTNTGGHTHIYTCHYSWKRTGDN